MDCWMSCVIRCTPANRLIHGHVPRLKEFDTMLDRTVVFSHYQMVESLFLLYTRSHVSESRTSLLRLSAM